MADPDAEYVPETDDEFIDRIHRGMEEARRAMGLPQRVLGERISHNQVWISVRERGKYRMTVDDASLVAAALRMPGKGKARKVTRPLISTEVRERGVTPATMPTFRQPVEPQRPPVGSKVKEEPAPVRQLVELQWTEKKPVTVEKTEPDAKVVGPWMWAEKVTVDVVGEEVKLPLLSTETNDESELQLTLKDALKLQGQLLLQLPERRTAVADRVTVVTASIEQSIKKVVTNNRRNSVMRMITPIIAKLVKEMEERVQDSRDAAEDAQAEAERTEAEANRKLELLNRKLAKMTAPPDVEDTNAAIVRMQGEHNQRQDQMRKQLEAAEKAKREAEAKLVRAREEIERLDGLVKTQDDVKVLPSICGSPEEHEFWENRIEEAMEALDEVHDGALLMKGSDNDAVRLKGYELVEVLKRHGFGAQDG